MQALGLVVWRRERWADFRHAKRADHIRIQGSAARF
jgi:hypothetical protein